jgi:hypothetical protein
MMVFQYEKCRGRVQETGREKAGEYPYRYDGEGGFEESRRKGSLAGGTGSHPSAFPFDDGQPRSQIREGEWRKESSTSDGKVRIYSGSSTALRILVKTMGPEITAASISSSTLADLR